MPARSRALLGATIALVLVGAGFAVRQEPPAPIQPSVPRAAAPAVGALVDEPSVAEDPSPASTPQARASSPQQPAQVQPRRVVVQTAERQRVATSVDQTTAQRRSGNPLKQVFPEQFAATQTASDPGTQHWALLIGINKYRGSTPNTVGSVPDARALRSHLLSLGWRSDHIMLLRDDHATAANIVHAIRWLRSKTDDSSVVVFHYAGHERPIYRSGRMRVAIWATDNRLIPDTDLGTELGRISHARMWIHFATCRAGGFNAPGTSKPNRVITYSSPKNQLSYEDPDYGHSVFGYHTIALGMKEGYADRNGDGIVTVEEAFAWAEPRVKKHTSNRQHPLIDDRYEGSFTLKVPPKPKRSPEPTPSPTSCGLLVCPSSGTATATSRER